MHLECIRASSYLTFRLSSSVCRRRGMLRGKSSFTREQTSKRARARCTTTCSTCYFRLFHGNNLHMSIEGAYGGMYTHTYTHTHRDRCPHARPSFTAAASPSPLLSLAHVKLSGTQFLHVTLGCLPQCSLFCLFVVRARGSMSVAGTTTGECGCRPALFFFVLQINVFLHGNLFRSLA